MICGVLATVVTEDEDTSMSVVANRFFFINVGSVSRFFRLTCGILSTVEVNFRRKSILGFYQNTFTKTTPNPVLAKEN